MSEEDEVSESVELAWETGFQRGLAKGREEAEALRAALLRADRYLALGSPNAAASAISAALQGAEPAPLKEKAAETGSTA